MKIKNGIIVEATHAELYGHYLAGEWYELYSFPEYVRYCQENGTAIIKGPQTSGDGEEGGAK